MYVACFLSCVTKNHILHQGWLRLAVDSLVCTQLDITTSNEDTDMATIAINHGMIGPFNSSQEDWLLYIICLQNYFIANDIMDDKAAKCREILPTI